MPRRFAQAVAAKMSGLRYLRWLFIGGGTGSPGHKRSFSHETVTRLFLNAFQNPLTDGLQRIV
jgi:hypothetical protein